MFDLVRAEYESTGISLTGHPIAFLRPSLAEEGILPLVELRELPNQAEARAVGILRLLQRPPTAKGTSFLLLEDETEVLNLVVPPRTTRRLKHLLKTARVLDARGRIERDGEVVNLVCEQLVRHRTGAASSLPAARSTHR